MGYDQGSDIPMAVAVAQPVSAVAVAEPMAPSVATAQFVSGSHGMAPVAQAVMAPGQPMAAAPYSGQPMAHAAAQPMPTSDFGAPLPFSMDGRASELEDGCYAMYHPCPLPSCYCAKISFSDDKASMAFGPCCCWNIFCCPCAEKPLLFGGDFAT